MKRLLLNCDQVFDVLTRGPFPTGQPEDEAVEQHLRACHECRQLAEALRPAVALLHEAVGADQAMDLPEYQGSLPMKRSDRRRLSVVRLATLPAMNRAKPPRTGPPSAACGERRQPQMISAVRFVAASLLIAALGLLFGGTMLAPGGKRLALKAGSFFSRSSAAADVADGLPSDAGLLRLASLKLPVACMPLTHRPLSAEHAAQLAAALSNGSLDALHCCTECHHAGLKQPQIATVAAISQQNCQACHRG